jgi:hypothetical protein
MNCLAHWHMMTLPASPLAPRSAYTIGQIYLCVIQSAQQLVLSATIIYDWPGLHEFLAGS